MRKTLSIYIFLCLVLFVFASGLSYFEDARSSRCLEKLRDPSWDDDNRKLWKKFEESQNRKSIFDTDLDAEVIESKKKDEKEREILQEKVDSEWQAEHQKRVRKYEKNRNECMSRVTPNSWSNFLLDLTL
jgi:hypothetical protein